MKPGWCDALTTCGSVAEWAAVDIARASLVVSVVATLVAAGGAVAVYLLGKKANALARTARELQDSADRREAVVLYRFMQPELRDMLIKARALRAHVDGDENWANYLASEHTRLDVNNLTQKVSMRLTRSVLHRLHVFDGRMSTLLAAALGNAQAMRDAAFEPLPADTPTGQSEAVLERIREHLVRLIDNLEAIERLGGENYLRV